MLGHFDHHSKKQEKEHFLNLLKVARTDGLIENKELEMLHRFGRRMGLTDPEIDTLIQTTGNSNYIPPYELSKRFDQVYDIVKMILADNIIEDSEMRFASSFALVSGFIDSEIPNLLELLINGIKQGIDEEDLFVKYKKTRQF